MEPWIGNPMDDLALKVCHFHLRTVRITEAATELKSKWLASELLPSRLRSEVWTVDMFLHTVPNQRDTQMAKK